MRLNVPFELFVMRSGTGYGLLFDFMLNVFVSTPAFTNCVMVE